MNVILTIIQVVISIFLITIIILQPKGAGLGSAFGGGAYTRTRRGSEKFLFQLTIVTSVLFIVISIANILI